MPLTRNTHDRRHDHHGYEATVDIELYGGIGQLDIDLYDFEPIYWLPDGLNLHDALVEIYDAIYEHQERLDDIESGELPVNVRYLTIAKWVR